MICKTLKAVQNFFAILSKEIVSNNMVSNACRVLIGVGIAIVTGVGYCVYRHTTY